MTLSPLRKSILIGIGTVAVVLAIAVGVRLLELLAKGFGNSIAILVFAVVIGLVASVGVYFIEREPKK